MRPISWCVIGVAVLGLAPVAAAAEAHGAERDNLFAGTLWQSGAAIVAFLLVLTILSKYAWGPILKGLQDRENKIREDLAGAEAANRKAQQTLADYERKVAETHAEARKLIDQARADAEAMRARLAAQTELEIGKMRDRARQEIKDARNQAVQELYARASELSIAVAEKILQRQITDADTQAMVDRSLKELEQLKAG